MNLTPLRMAMRFMRVSRSRGAVGAIAAVSVAGIAVAVAAIICVLSVFNGFHEVLTGRSARMIPDVEISRADGKPFGADSLLKAVRAVRGVAAAAPVVCDQALAIFGNREMPVRLYAVDPTLLPVVTDVDSTIYEGGRRPSAEVDFDKAPDGLISAGVASRLAALSPGSDLLFLFAPKRIGTINTANPAASFNTDSVRVCGIFESGDEQTDAATVILPPEVARPLFMLDDDAATAIAVRAAGDGKAADLARRLEEAAPEGYSVRTRDQQQQISYRMVNIEKWVTFLLLTFILMIASFNIISTMTIFVLEKRRDMRTLRAMGMTRRGIGEVFALQSAIVTLTGAAAGIVLGLALSLLQQHTGLITMGGDYPGAVPMAYPVKVVWGDFPIVLIPVLIIGAVTSRIAAAFARSRVRLDPAYRARSLKFQPRRGGDF